MQIGQFTRNPVFLNQVVSAYWTERDVLSAGHFPAERFWLQRTAAGRVTLVAITGHLGGFLSGVNRP